MKAKEMIETTTKFWTQLESIYEDNPFRLNDIISEIRVMKLSLKSEQR
jgi:hypothetical protein